MEAILDTINTTVGVRYIVLTYGRSKEFKTRKGAEKYMKDNGYTQVDRLD